MRFFCHLLLRHLRQYPGRVAAALVVLTAASALMLALAGMGAALRFRVGGYLAELFPEEKVWLEAGKAALGPVAFENKPINDETVKQVATRPEVEHVWPVEPVRFPISVSGNLFGQEVASDAVIHGVTRPLIEDALKKDQPWGAPKSPEGPYPIVVSRYFLDLYNLGLARANGMPLLSPSFLIGRHVKVMLGVSTVMGAVRSGVAPREVKGVVVGFTAQPAMIGLAMPEEVVHALNQEYAPNTTTQYVTLVVLLKKGADRKAFLKSVVGQGLVLSGGDVLGERIKTGVRVAGWALIGLSASIFALGMMTFYMLFTMIFHSRRLDLIRLRALGLSPVQVVGLALGEVGVIATSAVLLAGGANALLGYWAAERLRSWAEQMSWLPPNLLDPATGWLALASGAILVTTLLPALPVLRWVVTVEPAQVIRDM